MTHTLSYTNTHTLSHSHSHSFSACLSRSLSLSLFLCPPALPPQRWQTSGEEIWVTTAVWECVGLMTAGRGGEGRGRRRQGPTQLAAYTRLCTLCVWSTTSALTCPSARESLLLAPFSLLLSLPLSLQHLSSPSPPSPSLMVRLKSVAVCSFSGL